MILKWTSVISIQVKARTITDIKMSLESKSSTEYSIHSPSYHAVQIIMHWSDNTILLWSSSHALPSCWKINNRFKIVDNIKPIHIWIQTLCTFGSFKSKQWHWPMALAGTETIVWHWHCSLLSVPFFLIICKQASAWSGLVNETMPWYTDCFAVVVFVLRHV